MLGVWHAEATQPETAQPETTQTVAPVAESHDGGFVDLYRSHYPRLVSALRLAGAPPAQAQDAAQEAFARTYRHWRRVRAGTNPRGYVTTAAFRILRGGHDLAGTSLVADNDAPVTSHESLVIMRAGVEHALRAMPSRRRACAALCLYLDLPIDEAAESLGISPSTVRVQLHRARHDLRAALGEPVTD
ncbi:MAG TPA: sigma-70 family RNA polymerase sigma factor [Acidimicrobiales bacterium]|nr:sigma-70 family RNA polymerase sigma factor [Acidimicrobiales bacterium]